MSATERAAEVLAAHITWVFGAAGLTCLECESVLAPLQSRALASGRFDEIMARHQAEALAVAGLLRDEPTT